MTHNIENPEKNYNEDFMKLKTLKFLSKASFKMPEIDFDLDDIEETNLDDFVEDELKINSKTGFESELFGHYLKKPEIYQKVKLKVDENGAEGAAATVTSVST